ncbi:Hypothetical predicted protein [Cloeon dipterum]|uniref:Uncharacterized protein n=1 Tax=Cloeon dipterum TaxID=197152 RepID=A0A8S1DG94_9INSE|nr:Hypothetical predicted protein [Cloeon dipterum]
MQILRSSATPWVMGRRRRAGWPGTAMQILRSRATPCWMGRRRHADSPEQRDAVGDGQAAPLDGLAPPCRFSGAGRRRAGWAAPCANSPEQSDAVLDGQAPPCRFSGEERHRGDGQVPPYKDSSGQNDAALDGQAPPCKFSGAERRRAEWAGAAMQILRSRATPWVMGRRRRAGWPGTAMQILRSRATLRWMARRHHADSPEQRDAVGDGQVPPCRFSGAERRRAGWAGVAIRSRATFDDGRAALTVAWHRHADSPEQGDAVLDGQAPPCKFSGAERRRG